MRIVLSSAVATALVIACASRAAKPPASEPAQPAATVSEPQKSDAGVTAELPADRAPQTPPPRERLAWVNPTRCVTPCTYDPQDSLVRVDDRGLADSTGKHLVHRSIQDPLHELVAAAHAAGHKLRIESAFRSYEAQARLFRQIKQVGRAARAGHSEHQLGTAVDFRLPTTVAGVWLAAHAARFGFTLSYPDGKQRLTGYRPEPWHVRFVGLELASELRAKAWTLEDMFRARPEVGESGSCDDCPQPAAPPACDDITAAGACDGTVLKWCYDGALATVDCAASKQRCGRARGSDEHDCVTR